MKRTAEETFRINQKIRRDWGEIKPYTRIEENRKRKKKPKYKPNYREESE